MELDDLLEKIVEQIRQDIENEDHTALYELLSNAPVLDLLNYLTKD